MWYPSQPEDRKGVLGHMGFQNYSDYESFESQIRKRGRFGLSSYARNFLEIFVSQLSSKETLVPKETVFFRAARDYRIIEPDGNQGGAVLGADENRMFPKQEYSFEGRVKPSGIIVLYLATSETTAASEIRPWIGEMISIGTFILQQNLKLADLSNGDGQPNIANLTFSELEGKEDISQEKTDRLVWNSIDNAFSRPQTSTDTGAEYAPTQILAEAIKENGFDGLAYRSSFGGDRGYNVALFDPSVVQIHSCQVHEINRMELAIEEAGNRWFKS